MWANRSVPRSASRCHPGRRAIVDLEGRSSPLSRQPDGATLMAHLMVFASEDALVAPTEGGISIDLYELSLIVACGRSSTQYTDEFGSWWDGLSEGEQERIAAAVELLEEHGPCLGRPVVDTLQASRYPNMKELGPRGGHLRVLFAFDPRRTAILLCGGDKSTRWDLWYAEAITPADRLYGQHLEAIADEGRCDGQG